MTHLEIVEALTHLTPNADYVLNGDDYAEIIWLDESKAKPSANQIKTTIANLENIRKEKEDAVLAAKAEAEAQRQALLDKLGITEDEAKLLLGGV